MKKNHGRTICGVRKNKVHMADYDWDGKGAKEIYKTVFELV